MATSRVSVTLNAETKGRMDAIAERLGTTTAGAMAIFASSFVEHQGFPFVVALQSTREAEAPIDRSKIYKPTKTIMGDPVLPAEWYDPEGDIYDSLA